MNSILGLVSSLVINTASLSQYDPLANCAAPATRAMMTTEINQMIAPLTVYKIVATQQSQNVGGRSVCLIGFWRSDGVPVNGFVGYQYDLNGNLLITFQELPGY